MPSAQIGGTRGYDHSSYRHLVRLDRFPAVTSPDMLHLVSLASVHAEIALRLVLEIVPPHAMVSTALVFDDLRAPLPATASPICRASRTACSMVFNS